MRGTGTKRLGMSLLEEKLSFLLLQQSGSMSGASLYFAGASLLAARRECSRGGCMAKEHRQRGAHLEQSSGSSDQWLVPAGWIYERLGKYSYSTKTMALPV